MQRVAHRPRNPQRVLVHGDVGRDDELAKDATGGVLDEASLPAAPSETLALPYYNWPDGVLGAEWQVS